MNLTINSSLFKHEIQALIKMENARNRCFGKRSLGRMFNELSISSKVYFLHIITHIFF